MQMSILANSLKKNPKIQETQNKKLLYSALLDPKFPDRVKPLEISIGEIMLSKMWGDLGLIIHWL